jgi:hypothetical protein
MTLALAVATGVVEELPPPEQATTDVTASSKPTNANTAKRVFSCFARIHPPGVFSDGELEQRKTP